MVYKKDPSISELQRFYEEESQYMNRKVKGYFEEVLAGNAPTTTEVNIKFINLGEEGSMHLIKVLPYFSNLKSLRLWKTKLGIEGAKLLSGVLGKLSQLEILSLEDNELKTEGTSYIAQALVSLPLISELYLHVNKMGYEGVVALKESFIYKTNLKVLTMDENYILKPGLVDLLASLCKTLNKLTLLGLSFNQLGDEGVRELLRYLPEMPNLKKLTLSGNNLTPALERELVAAAPAIDFFF